MACIILPRCPLRFTNKGTNRQSTTIITVIVTRQVIIKEEFTSPLCTAEKTLRYNKNGNANLKTNLFASARKEGDRNLKCDAIYPPAISKNKGATTCTEKIKFSIKLN